MNRLFWVIAFMVSLGLSAYLISEPLRKYRESPVIVSFDEKATPVWAIPFPTVTICAETKVDLDEFNCTIAEHIIIKSDDL